MTYEEKEALARTRDTSKEAAAVRLLAARRVTGLSQGEFGSATNVSKAAIANAENGRSYPSRDAMIFLHREHRIDFNFMIAGEFSQLPLDVQTRLFETLASSVSELDQTTS